jgi:MFS family permease
MRAELRGYPARAFAVCLFAYAFTQMDLALFGYAIPSIREEFGLSLSGVMAIVSSAFVIGGVLIVWLGLTTDRLGRRRMFQLSFVGSSLLIALHSIVPNPATLTALRGTSIAVGGLTYPITGAVIAEEFPARLRGLFLGLLQIGYPLGWALASVLAAWLLVDYGWRYLFLVGLLSLPFIIVINRTIREPERFVAAKAQQATPVDRAKIVDLFAPGVRRTTFLLFGAQLMFVWAYAGSVFLFPSFLAEDRGLAKDAYSILIGTGHAIGILGYIAAAMTGEFLLTRRDTAVIWVLLGSITFQFLIWQTETFAGTLIGFGVMSMFFYGSAAVKFAYLAEMFPTRLRATGLAFCGSLAVTLGSAGGPYMVSRVVEQVGWDLGLSVVVGVPLCLAGFLYLFLARVPSGLEIEEIQSYVGGRKAR